MSSTADLTADSTMDLHENQPAPRQSFKQFSFKNKVKYVREVITVEPLLCCYIMPTILGLLTVQNMKLEAACRGNLKLDDQICIDLLSGESASENSTQEYESEAQKVVTSMIAWQTVLQSGIPAILILFLGSYSDRHKRRKPFLIMPLIGETLSMIGFIICAINIYTWPVEVTGVSEALFPALSGGSTTMMMAVYSYVADVSTVEMRTLRIGIVHLTATIIFPIGTSLSGILFKTIGYFGVYSISLMFYILAFYYGIFVLKEPRQTVDTKRSFCVDFFDPKHAIDTFSIIYRKREGSKRLRIILLMLVFIVIIGPTYGESSVVYYYTRKRFNWDAVNYSLYSAYDVVIHLIGTTLAITVLSQMFKLDDLLLAAFACACKVAASFLYAFSGTPTLFYFAPVISLMSGAGSIAMRSIATKIVSIDELGKIQSLFGICEAIAPIIYSTIYSRLYIATIETFPGAFFLLGAALITPSIFIFLFMYFLQKGDVQDSTSTNSTFAKPTEQYTYTGTKDL